MPTPRSDHHPMPTSRRSSLGGSASPGSTHDLRPRVIACLNKLADRDTLALAAGELDAIARALTHDSFSPFLACLHNTDDATRTPVRKHCVSLLALMSDSHGDSLAPFLPRMLATVLRRLRDPDSAVRAACVGAAAAMSARITRPPFGPAFVRPLVEAMATEQDAGAQIGAALCLAAAIEAAPEPDAAQLRRSLPRLGKLARSEGFKAKAAILALIGSVVGVGGASSVAVLDWLVPSVVEFLSSEDWAVRKAAAEALGRVATAETELAEKYRDSCVSALETRRFDKVKVVRETMNQTLEQWKEVSSGVSEEFSSPTRSRSSTDNGEVRCSQDLSFRTPQTKKSTVPANWSPPSDSDRSLRSSIKKESPVKSKKTEIAQDENITKKNNASPKPETKHFLFNKAREERAQRFGGSRSGSRVVPFNDDDDDDDNDDKKGGSEFIDRNVVEEVYDDCQKDAEGLFMIREQLLQIENQQSSLLDLLQRFMGSSQSGLNSLETRVNGIEVALEEMSYNMGLSNGGNPSAESANDACCRLPGADFLSSKFWRRPEGRYSTQNFSSSLDVRRFHHQNGRQIFSSDSGDILDNSRRPLNRMAKNFESLQIRNSNGSNGA